MQWDLVSFITTGKGAGLKTLSVIPEGSFVIEYMGEVITTQEAAERTSKQKPGESSYLLTLQEHFGSTSYKHHIDASCVGNESRFINHSCAPNLFLLPVRVDSATPLLTFFALRDIGAGEELTYDYGRDLGEPDSARSERLYNGTQCKVKCLCGVVECR